MPGKISDTPFHLQILNHSPFTHSQLSIHSLISCLRDKPLLASSLPHRTERDKI